MEADRIHYAAVGAALIILFSASSGEAQDAPFERSDSLKQDIIKADTSETGISDDSLNSAIMGIFGEDEQDSLFGSEDTSYYETIPDSSDTIHLETNNPTAYYKREFLSRGTADELKGASEIFMYTPGPNGSPQIPLRYLNTPGVEIYLNQHPFLYNDIYRPYVIGSDLNVVPWEILNEIHWNDSVSNDDRIHIDLGRPPDDANRSDVELARGPYSYNSSRWRFFRPFGSKTYGYFTVGFNKSSGYLQNTDYNGYHVTGGGSRVLFDGLLEFNVWKYKAKSGLNTFEFLTPQVYRHSRTTHRYELSYKRSFDDYLDLDISGMYQKNGLIAEDLMDTLSIDRDIGGARLSLAKSYENQNINLGMSYYNLRLYKLPGIEPSANQIEYFGRLIGSVDENQVYDLGLTYSWNGIDHGELLPNAKIDYKIANLYTTFVSYSRSRRLPDLNLNYYNNQISIIGLPGVLETYSFQTSSNLKSPVTSRVTAGIGADWDWVSLKATASQIDIKNQIYLAYQSDTTGNFIASPVNFDDDFLEITGSATLKYSYFNAELGGSYRSWKDKYFDDGLEKGPAAIGFGRLSALKSFFFDDLFLGGSLEMRIASRQDYRSIRVGYLDAYGVLNGRLEFQYKDFIFWWNEDNLTNNNYSTWWPYPRIPRTLWWGFRWRFYD